MANDNRERDSKENPGRKQTSQQGQQGRGGSREQGGREERRDSNNMSDRSGSSSGPQSAVRPLGRVPVRERPGLWRFQAEGTSEGQRTPARGASPFPSEDHGERRVALSLLNPRGLGWAPARALVC
jgi:hypothetical protein